MEKQKDATHTENARAELQMFNCLMFIEESILKSVIEASYNGISTTFPVLVAKAWHHYQYHC